MCVIVPNFIKIGQTAAKIWPPSWICEIRIFNGRSVKKPILHQSTKFRKDRSNRCGDIAFFCEFEDGGCRHLEDIVIFVIFQDGGRRHLEFLKIRNYNELSAVWGQCTSSCQISSKSVKRSQRYGDLTVFKMAAVRHLGL